MYTSGRFSAYNVRKKKGQTDGRTDIDIGAKIMLMGLRVKCAIAEYVLVTLNDLEGHSPRSFPVCRPFQVQSVEHLCSILPDFYCCLLYTSDAADE